MSDFDKLMSRNKALVAPEAGSQADGLTLDHMRRCFFGGYTDPDAEASTRVYKEVQDVASLITTMEAYLADHNGMRACTWISTSFAGIHVKGRSNRFGR